MAWKYKPQALKLWQHSFTAVNTPIITEALQGALVCGIVSKKCWGLKISEDGELRLITKNV